MSIAKDFHLVQAPDGFYFGRILKSGMISADARRITDEEVMAMFEDVMRRNRARTGRTAMSVFAHGRPVLLAKLDPDIRECGVV